METIKKEKVFDTVKMMREIRDKISVETKNMTLAELKRYIQDQLKASSFKPVGQ
jgi:CO dehydrogenase/acetyl-CoA synthase beta subunit